jgi:hypothetical protein
MFSIAEEPEQGPHISGGGEDSLDEQQSSSQSPSVVPEEDFEKENARPGGEKQAPNRRKRRSIGQQSTRKKKTPSASSSTASGPGLQKQTLTAPSVEESPIEADESVLEQSPDQVMYNDRKTAKSAAGRPSLPPKRRKKRKSVVLVKKKRRSSEGAKPLTKGANFREDVRSNQDEEGEEDVEAPSVPSVRRRGRQPSPVARSSPIMRSIEVDEASDEEYIDEENSPEPPTPAPSKKGRKTAKAGRTTKKSTNRGTTQSNARRRKTTFPVLTHRITNLGALPTIEEEAENRNSDEGEGVSAEAHSFGNRAAPNAVDVLAQICRETIETAIERMETEVTGESRAVRQRKRTAMEAFGADLDSRLFEMSAAVEDRVNLEARARKVKREKADLQARWIEVRKQRDVVALKCDRVRREHWENEQAMEARWRISEAARKSELELERDSPEEEEGLEFLLHSVAEEVTNAHEGGGLLNRMKSLNLQLERMAGMLEGRVA